MVLIQGDLSWEEFKILKRAVRYFMEGVEKGTRKKFEDAQKIFESLEVRKSPLEILRGRGGCAEIMDDLKSASHNYREGFRESKRVSNEKLAHWFWQRRVEVIAMELCQKGKETRAIRILKLASEKDSSNSEFHRLLVSIYADQKDWDLVLEELNKFTELEKNPKRLAAGFLRKGFAWEEKGNFGEAEKAYLEAIKLDPNEPRAYFYLGFIYLEQEEEEKAYQEWQRAEKLDSQNPNLLYNLVNLSFRLEEWEKGREYLRKIIEIDSVQVKEIFEVAPSKEAYQIILEEIGRRMGGVQKRDSKLEESLLSVLGDGKINLEWAKETLIERKESQSRFIQRKIRKKQKVKPKDYLILEAIEKGLEKIKEVEIKTEGEIIQKFEAKGWSIKKDKRLSKF